MKKVNFDPVEKVTQLLEAQHALDASRTTESMGVVIGTRLRDWIAVTPLSTLFLRVVQAFALMVWAVSLWMGWDVYATFVRILAWHHGFLPGLCAAWVVLFRGRAILSAFRRGWEWLRENADCPWPDFIRSLIAGWLGIPMPGVASGDPTSDFGGLKRTELLGFLKSRRHLNCSQYMAAYPKSRKNDVTRVAKGLLAAGILVKGRDNANVLTEALDWSVIEARVNAAVSPEEMTVRDEPIRIRLMNQEAPHPSGCSCMSCQGL